ncbi:MAG: ATP-binding protein [Candidatus Melainabacteria bacterium]|nr:ATP-binding protein [Candidatus Melainabacteria bacterium]
MRIFHKGLFLIAIPLAFQLVFFVALIVALEFAESTVDSQIALAERRLLAYKAFSECHAVVTIVTADSMDPDPGVFKELKAKEFKANELIAQMQSDKTLTEKDAAAINEMKSEVAKYFTLMNGAVKLNNRKIRLTLEEKLGFYALLDIRIKKVSSTVEPMFQSQTRADNHFIKERGALLDSLKTWTIAGLLASILLSAGATFAFSRGFVKRIKHLKENSLKLSHGEALLPSLKGTDEIAELDKVFHGVATAFRDSYQRELAMFDSAADLIFCLNHSGEIERVNQVLTDSLGHDAESAIGADIRSFVLEDDRESINNFLEKVKSNKGQRLETEVRMISSDADPFDYQWSARWEPSRKTFYCVAHDVTERKRLEQAKQDFVAMLSHDLRSPLAALAITIEMVVEGAVQKMPDKCVNVFAMAQKSVERLVNLINELLDLEKLEAGEMEITPSVVPVNRVFQTAMDSLRMSAAEQGVELEAIDHELSVRADEERIVRVLINLLSNAIKYSRSGDKVTLMADRIQNDGIEISVIDQGPGIPPDKLDNIFERYKQVQDAEKIHKQGSGLGLSICKAIVEAHGGTIGVVSRLGAGSTFWFKLPEVD